MREKRSTKINTMVFACFIIGTLVSVFYEVRGGTSYAGTATKVISHLGFFVAFALMVWEIGQSFLHGRLRSPVFVASLLCWTGVVIFAFLLECLDNGLSAGSITFLENCVIWSVGGVYAYMLTRQRRLSTRKLVLFFAVLASIYCLRSIHLYISLGGSTGLLDGNQGISERQTMIRQVTTQYSYAMLWCLPLMILNPARRRMVWGIVAACFVALAATGKLGIYLSVAAAGLCTIVSMTFGRYRKPYRISSILGVAFLALIFALTMRWHAEYITNIVLRKLELGLGAYRQEIWSALWNSWNESNPLTMLIGHGFLKSKTYLGLHYGIDIFAHSDWLEALYDFGLIGFMLILSIHLSILGAIRTSYALCPQLLRPLLIAYAFIFVASLISTTVVIGSYALCLYFTLGHLVALVHRQSALRVYRQVTP